MKLLYLSCHSILEYDELKMFQELGIDYFSMGSYVVPTNPADKIRPPLPYDPYWLTHPIPPRDEIPKSFVDQFDAIVVMHVPEWITTNWDKFKHKTVIWRTIGQSTPDVENRLKEYRNQGLKVVRYSPREERIRDNIGSDAMIRFYKDENEFNGWTGGTVAPITVAQDMIRRGKFCNYDAFSKIVNGFNGKLYGRNNENAGELGGGELTYEEMKQKMRDARVYVYTGTQPASYTLNFIEAYMTGAPIVAIGSNIWGSLMNELNINDDLYEIPDIIQNGVNGFYSDDIGELRQYVSDLLNDYKQAQRIGRLGRDRAIQLFGKNSVRLAWKSFFDSL